MVHTAPFPPRLIGLKEVGINKKTIVKQPKMKMEKLGISYLRFITFEDFKNVDNNEDNTN